jgi:hypothetical protein
MCFRMGLEREREDAINHGRWLQCEVLFHACLLEG